MGWALRFWLQIGGHEARRETIFVRLKNDKALIASLQSNVAILNWINVVSVDIQIINVLIIIKLFAVNFEKFFWMLLWKSPRSENRWCCSLCLTGEKLSLSDNRRQRQKYKTATGFPLHTLLFQLYQRGMWIWWIYFILCSVRRPWLRLYLPSSRWFKHYSIWCRRYFSERICV